MSYQYIHNLGASVRSKKKVSNLKQQVYGKIGRISLLNNSAACLGWLYNEPPVTVPPVYLEHPPPVRPSRSPVSDPIKRMRSSKKERCLF